jgi:murein DD-endopeptidase MepM/ murein hydrolase activator NlpD
LKAFALNHVALVALTALPVACATVLPAGPVAVPTAQVTSPAPAPATAPPVTAAPPEESQAMLELARLARALDLPGAPALLDHMVHWQLDMRNFVHGVEHRLATLVDHTGLVIPDLTVLSIEPVAHAESSGFGWRDDPIRHTRRFHSGSDFRGKPGTAVLAAGDGVVVFCGRLGGYGNAIDIDHGGGVLTRYAHLRRIEATKGAAITAGATIGRVGSTGRATGPHLHFEVRLDGAPVSPITAMSVAALQRESPEAGRLAALALTPELQSAAESEVDPPRQRARAGQRPAQKPARPAAPARPERPGQAKRQQVLW